MAKMDYIPEAHRVNGVTNRSIAGAHRGFERLPPTSRMQRKTDSPEPIAIIGIALKFPQDASDTEAFWRLLLEKRSALSKVPKERYNADAFEVGHEGHFIREDLGAFDAPFFSVSPAEAENMDPQQRWLLETTYQALENAGIAIDDVKKTQTSVHVGNFTHDFEKLAQMEAESLERHRVIGSSMSILANRISWFYDLQGPSMVVDTACSSSLVALHLACQTLREGGANMGIVAGVNLLFDPSSTANLGNLGFLSPDNKCYSFDDRANGYSRGEGLGVVLIKPLSKALKDGDAIRAIIRGTGSNQDGRTPGITQPSGTAQTDLIRASYQRAGLDMSPTRYFEAHGTGTAIGDPTEARAIADAFDCSDREHIYVGAVKSNVGHLEGASGIAGLIKAVLVLERGLIPANVWFERVNPKIQAEAWGLRFPTETVPWPSPGLRRASINSFGFGGTNAHAILDDAENYLWTRGFTSNVSRYSTMPENGSLDHSRSISRHDTTTQIVVLTAFDEAGIQRLASRLLQAHIEGEQLSHGQYLQDIAYTLNEKRTKLPWRSFATISSTESSADPDWSEPIRANNDLKLCFVFTGQGAQWRHMGQELLRFDVFKRSIDRAEKFLSSLGCYWSITELLFMDFIPEDGYGNVDDAQFSQPLCTVIQVALVDLLESWGISPAIVVGHSSGEIAAAYCSRAISDQLAWTISYYRGLAVAEAFQHRSVRTTMISVQLSPESVQPYLSQCNKKGLSDDDTTIACYNSPSNVTVAGTVEGVDLLASMLDQDNVPFRRLKVDVAYHSSHMRESAEIYRQYLQHAQIDRAHGKGPLFISTVTESQVGPTELQSADYWVANMVNPVMFSNVMRLIVNPKRQKLYSTNEIDANFLVELGPHSTLRSPLRAILKDFDKDVGKIYTSALVRDQPALQSILKCVGKLSCSGYPVNLAAINRELGQGQKPQLVTTLPSYPFNHSQSYWSANRLAQSFRFRNLGRHELLGTSVPDWNPLETRWNNKLIVKDAEFLGHHIVNGLKIYPAAGMLVMAIEASRQLATTKAKVTGFRFRDVTFTSVLPLNDSASGTETQFFLRPAQESTGDTLRNWSEFRLCVWENDACRECCRGAISTEYTDETWSPTGTIERDETMAAYESKCHQIQGKCNLVIEKEAVYSVFENMGLTYGPTFQGLDYVSVDNTGNATGRVNLQHWRTVDPRSTCKPHLIHPSALDAILQLGYPALTGTEGLADSPTIVPTCLKSMWISNDIGAEDQLSSVDLCATARKTGLRDVQASLIATSNRTGRVQLTIDASMTAVDHNVRNPSQQLGPSRPYYKVNWQPDAAFIAGSQQLDPTSCAAKPNGITPKIDVDTHINKEWFCLSVMTTAIQNLPATYKAPQAHLQRYVDWMKRKISASEDSFDRYLDAKDLSKANPSSFHETIRSADSEGYIIAKIADDFSKILSGDIDPLQLLFSDNSLEDLYGEHWALGLKSQLKPYIREMGHKTPGLKILEIGAGTGGMTSIILEGIDAFPKNPRGTSYLAEYVFTDISPSFFMNAREKFGEVNMKYQTLDITADVEKQGFQLGYYDIVAASNVLHATIDLEKTLQNCRKLLKTDGKLILHENMDPDGIMGGMIFGLLPGWWLSVEENRQWSPLQSRANWQNHLLGTGFSGEDILFKESNTSNSDAIRGGVMVSTAISSSGRVAEVHSTPIVTIVYDQSSDAQYGLYRELERQHAASQMKSLLHCVPFQNFQDINLSESTIVFLPPLDGFTLRTLTSEQFAILQAICTQASRMLWISRDSSSTGNLDSSMAVGMARSIESENFDFSFIMLTIEASSAASRIGDYVWHIVNQASSRSSSGYENEYVERSNVLHIPRVVESASVTDLMYSNADANREVTRRWGDESRTELKLCLESVGLLDSFIWQETEPRTADLTEEEVEVQVLAVGLNFVDVLTALGQVERDYLGNELAGVVTKVPDNGTVDLKVGDVVIGCHNGTMATRIRCQAWQLHVVPPHLSVVEAATLPLVYCTAYYSLVTWARAQPGESVLIHSGAGGVGQAAIQIAKDLGLTIFTTTSSDEKVKLLMDKYGIPKSHIFSSRSLDFVDGVRRLTHGVGVDVVLNSLSGEALRESFNLVAPFGRFVELGKRDIHSTGISALGGLPMRTFSKNVMFASVDLPSLYLKGNRISGVLDAVVKLAAEGKIKPPAPIHVFTASETEQAFRLMQTGKNTGKIVIDYSTNDTVKVRKMKRKQLFALDATYVIAGGLGGIAKSICKWMVQRGAKNLILLSRSAPSDADVRTFLQPLRAGGVTVEHRACDVADASHMQEVLDAEKSRMPPVKGCIQAAMVMQNCSFSNMTIDQWSAAIKPKVDGSWNLHALLPKGMDFFIMLSSHSGLIGGHGQSNYAAGNAFQDELARHRILHGEKAVSIDLGRVPTVGYVAKNEDVVSSALRLGLEDVSEAEILTLLEHHCEIGAPLLEPSDAQIVTPLALPATFKAKDMAEPAWLSKPMLRHLHHIPIEVQVSNGGVKQRQSWQALLRAANSMAEGEDIVREAICKQLADLLAIGEDDVDASKPVFSYGVDSLVAVELRNWFSKSIGADVPVLELLGNFPIKSLAGSVAKKSSFLSVEK